MKGRNIFVWLFFLFLLSVVSPIGIAPTIGSPDSTDIIAAGAGYRFVTGIDCSSACTDLSGYKPSNLLATGNDERRLLGMTLSYTNRTAEGRETRLPVANAPIIIYIESGAGGAGGSGSSSVQLRKAYTDASGRASYDFSGLPGIDTTAYSFRMFYCHARSACEFERCFIAVGLDATRLGVTGIDDIAPVPGAAASGSVPEQSPRDVLPASAVYSYVPRRSLGAGTPAFCFPLTLIFALLAGAMYLSGRNPLSLFDFSTPRMGKYVRYIARGRGAYMDVQAVAGAAKTVKGIKGIAAKEKEGMKKAGPTGILATGFRSALGATAFGRGMEGIAGLGGKLAGMKQAYAAGKEKAGKAIAATGEKGFAGLIRKQGEVGREMFKAAGVRETLKESVAPKGGFADLLFESFGKGGKGGAFFAAGLLRMVPGIGHVFGILDAFGVRFSAERATGYIVSAADARDGIRLLSDVTGKGVALGNFDPAAKGIGMRLDAKRGLVFDLPPEMAKLTGISGFAISLPSASRKKIFENLQNDLSRFHRSLAAMEGANYIKELKALAGASSSVTESSAFRKWAEAALKKAEAQKDFATALTCAAALGRTEYKGNAISEGETDKARASLLANPDFMKNVAFSVTCETLMKAASTAGDLESAKKYATALNYGPYVNPKTGKSEEIKYADVERVRTELLAGKTKDAQAFTQALSQQTTQLAAMVEKASGIVRLGNEITAHQLQAQTWANLADAIGRYGYIMDSDTYKKSLGSRIEEAEKRGDSAAARQFAAARGDSDYRGQKIPQEEANAAMAKVFASKEIVNELVAGMRKELGTEFDAKRFNDSFNELKRNITETFNDQNIKIIMSNEAFKAVADSHKKEAEKRGDAAAAENYANALIALDALGKGKAPPDTAAASLYSVLSDSWFRSDFKLAMQAQAGEKKVVFNAAQFDAVFAKLSSPVVYGAELNERTMPVISAGVYASAANTAADIARRTFIDAMKDIKAADVSQASVDSISRSIAQEKNAALAGWTTFNAMATLFAYDPRLAAEAQKMAAVESQYLNPIHISDMSQFQSGLRAGLEAARSERNIEKEKEYASALAMRDYTASDGTRMRISETDILNASVKFLEDDKFIGRIKANALVDSIGSMVNTPLFTAAIDRLEAEGKIKPEEAAAAKGGAGFSQEDITKARARLLSDERFAASILPAMSPADQAVYNMAKETYARSTAEMLHLEVARDQFRQVNTDIALSVNVAISNLVQQGQQSADKVNTKIEEARELLGLATQAGNAKKAEELRKEIRDMESAKDKYADTMGKIAGALNFEDPVRLAQQFIFVRAAADGHIKPEEAVGKLQEFNQQKTPQEQIKYARKFEAEATLPQFTENIEQLMLRSRPSSTLTDLANQQADALKAISRQLKDEAEKAKALGAENSLRESAKNFESAKSYEARDALVGAIGTAHRLITPDKDIQFSKSVYGSDTARQEMERALSKAVDAGVSDYVRGHSKYIEDRLKDLSATPPDPEDIYKKAIDALPDRVQKRLTEGMQRAEEIENALRPAGERIKITTDQLIPSALQRPSSPYSRNEFARLAGDAESQFNVLTGGAFVTSDSAAYNSNMSEQYIQYLRLQQLQAQRR